MLIVAHLMVVGHVMFQRASTHHGRTGNPKIGQEAIHISTKQHVIGLDISMNKVLTMQVVQCQCNFTNPLLHIKKKYVYEEALRDIRKYHGTSVPTKRIVSEISEKSFLTC